jgi:lipopolysaccharide heptosyltransferase II
LHSGDFRRKLKGNRDYPGEAVLDRILILRNQGIGDLILITPAIRAVRRLHPQAHLTAVVGQWSRVALEGNPHLDEIISYPDPWIQKKSIPGYLRLTSILRAQKFRVAYIFHSHTLIHLLAVLARIPTRYGFFDLNLKKGGRFLTDRAEWQPNTDRYIADNYLDIPRLAGFRGDDLELDFRLTDDEQARADELLSELSIQPGRFLIVAPGGGVNPRQNVFEKRWGADKFAELCRRLYQETGLPILLIGSAQERDLGREIVSAAGRAVLFDWIGKISFRRSAGLIRRARMLICNDSAVMHVAVAFRTPSLTIFGPSNPRSLLPVSTVNQWISSGVDCSPCYCNSIFMGCEHLKCMRELSADAVADRVLQMLPASAPEASAPGKTF